MLHSFQIKPWKILFLEKTIGGGWIFMLGLLNEDGY